MRRVVAVAAVSIVLLSGCSSEDGGGGDALQVVADPTAAVAARSPEPEATPAGTVLPLGEDVTATVADSASRTLVVATADPAQVLLYDLDALTEPPKSVALPSAADDLSLTDGAVLISMRAADEIARVSLPSGEVATVAVEGGPVAATERGGQTLVALRDGKGIGVLEGDRTVKTITDDLYSADDVLVSGDKTVVLDRLRTAVFDVDLEAGTVNEGLRAGMGATNAVTDSYGRVLVADTRGGALLAFSTDPLLMRQRYPVPGGIYDIAYDERRHLAWVTLTGSNEVVGFDVQGGEPTEKFRLPTVRQPNSVTVDPQTSQVVVGSAAGEGIQVVTP
ncbi:hypothetical protein BAY61_15320 [Prauserella marina]|uniref:Uncharacterized protein n=1 Tax=Prauserella marina TaxID=530584 RepID=A0A222VQC6_9PSEU|nr:hypothetical protein [Prauserella marina]ASR36146.1 hypothetical protein BAY61_15320 [Prauserella marina]PWV76892.1 hypothetical protein DES30_105109 [Prauserella marina]SDC99845.1 hypothetical protein SAMN05421630_105110 [Prauserella marina]